jgi:phosphatidate phosphatase
MWSAAFWKSFAKRSFPFVFGLGITFLATSVSKNTIGRLRPNFMEVCRPLPYWNQTICSDQNDLITDYTCTGTNSFMLKQIHMSFFSGHSSLTAYAMVYLVLVMERRITLPVLTSFKTLAQSALLILASYVGYTRVSDYWHHWEDVTIGLLVGSLIAVFIERSLCRTVNQQSVHRFSSINHDAEASEKEDMHDQQ